MTPETIAQVQALAVDESVAAIVITLAPGMTTRPGVWAEVLNALPTAYRKPLILLHHGQTLETVSKDELRRIIESPTV